MWKDGQIFAKLGKKVSIGGVTMIRFGTVMPLIVSGWNSNGAVSVFRAVPATGSCCGV
jgi:hypothetical protein